MVPDAIIYKISRAVDVVPFRYFIVLGPILCNQLWHQQVRFAGCDNVQNHTKTSLCTTFGDLQHYTAANTNIIPSKQGEGWRCNTNSNFLPLDICTDNGRLWPLLNAEMLGTSTCLLQDLGMKTWMWIGH